MATARATDAAIGAQDRFELAFVDDAAHFITDDAPDEVIRLALEWFESEGRAA
ncbi:hypothetical protein ACI7YT_04945 [Microbacterium sp. M]|uniref:hypothetical protein n=1 Tax=Microbacterium sp. M TaxID=3377125 RepID=UPI003868D337